MLDVFLTFLLYLFYGMIFFAMGVAITSRDTSASNLKVAPFLWLFSLFAYTHAFHEWSELYLIVFCAPLSLDMSPLIGLAKLALKSASFILLLLFGMNLFRIVFPGKYYRLCLIPLILTVCWLLFILFFSQTEFTPFLFQEIDFRLRNFIGLPAAVISGTGFIFYSKTVEKLSVKGAQSFAGAGVSLIAYGILTGLVPSGTSLPVLGVPVELGRGICAFVVLHFIMNALHIFDIERNMLIEERLHRFAKSEKLHSLGKLAFGIAHEINNPLTNVSINVELLKKDLAAQNISILPTKRFETIERNLERATKIAGELLSFSSQNESDFQATDLNDVIVRTLDLIGARRKAYEIRTDFHDVPSISAVPWKLEEVFLNIILNAMDAMPDGGTVTLFTERKKNKIVARIKDTGHGIAPENFDKVLDPFYTTREVGKGTGLGLSICFAIMESHGGKIEIQSEVGKGTVVSLFFPIGVNNDE